MSCENRFTTELHQRGLRLTPQREKILSVLHHMRSPATAEEIHQRVAESGAGVELSTVYRTLDLLQSFGLISVIDKGERQHRYKHVGTERPHFHLACRGCGKVIGIDLAEAAEFATRIESAQGFRPDIAQVTLPGICRECR
jgi:Fur family transcriptional regulator, ferric uptake regulator